MKVYTRIGGKLALFNVGTDDAEEAQRAVIEHLGERPAKAAPVLAVVEGRDEEARAAQPQPVA
jgi:hypothetical protein